MSSRRLPTGIRRQRHTIADLTAERRRLLARVRAEREPRLRDLVDERDSVRMPRVSF